MTRRRNRPGLFVITPGLLAFLLLGSAAAQTESGATKSDPEAGNPPSALEILNRAAAAQIDGGKAPDVTSFEGRFSFKLYGKDGKPLVGDVHQHWASRAGPDGTRYAYRREGKHDSNRESTTLVLGYDDTLWKPGALGGDVLRGKDHAEDKEDMRAERRRIRELIDLFFLARLDYDRPTLRVVAREPLEFRFKRFRFEFATTVLGLKDKRGRLIRLWIDDATNLLVRARITTNGSTEDFYMAEHRLVRLGRAGRQARVPMYVRYFEDDRPRIDISTRSAKTVGINTITETERRKLFELPD